MKIDRRQLLFGGSALALAAALPRIAFAETFQYAVPEFRLDRVIDEATVELVHGDHRQTLKRGEAMKGWTLVEIVPGEDAFVIVEDFAARESPMVLVGTKGIIDILLKTAESTAQDLPKGHLGYSWEEVTGSPTDLLGQQILSKLGDPEYDDISKAFPPIRKVWGDTYNFLGTPDTMDKIWFAYGGRSPNFDPAVYHRPVEDIRKAGKVLDGLLGGYLPVLRFVYPDGADYTEMLAFAPFRTVNDNARFQPVWYRVTHVKAGKLAWIKHVDSYLPYPPRIEDDAPGFYRDLVTMKARWDAILAEGMQVELPDARMADMARHSLIRSMMGRSAGFPKYGVVDKNYGGSEHDGFPDTFTVETEAMLEWGLDARAGEYINNYLGKFVRDDGTILYRGPETGQFGRMLTVIAQYANHTRDIALLKKHRKRIEALIELLRVMRAKARKLPKTDPAYGMISGWSEADAVLEPDPQRYMQPYFSNSTEAIRGFRDIGEVWRSVGWRDFGLQLLVEADELEADLQKAITRSTLTVDGERILPTVAGAKEPFHIVMQHDRSDPQWRSYRSWMEMLHSGELTKEQIDGVIDYRSRHHDVILGVPMAYGYKTFEMAGFLSYGHGYGLIQNDRIEEALLMTYSHMAHQYTRGMWMAPETRKLAKDEWAAPYCGPAQLVQPLMLRWLLAFEDPQSETLWLGKGIPRDWLQAGRRLSVRNIPTRWGRTGYEIEAGHGSISAMLSLPRNMSAETRLRLRAPMGKLQSVSVNGAKWTGFDSDAETIILPPGRGGKIDIVGHY